MKPWNDHKFCNMFWFVVYLLYFSRILCYLNWVQLVNFDFFVNQKNKEKKDGTDFLPCTAFA